MKVEYFLTLLTIVNAGIVTFVAVMQYKLAKDKFKFDLFEKRLAIYKEIERFLQRDMAKVETTDALDFIYNTKDAVFLFGDDIRYYLDEIFKKAIKLELIRLENPYGPFPGRQELLEWFVAQLTSPSRPLIAIFSPYLRFGKWNK